MLPLVMLWTRSQQTSPRKGQVANIRGFMGHSVLSQLFYSVAVLWEQLYANEWEGLCFNKTWFNKPWHLTCIPSICVRFLIWFSSNHLTISSLSEVTSPSWRQWLDLARGFNGTWPGTLMGHPVLFLVNHNHFHPMFVSPFEVLSSVQFSRSVVSNSLRPHGLQRARPPCPLPTPGVYSNSCSLSR